MKSKDTMWQGAVQRNRLDTPDKFEQMCDVDSSFTHGELSSSTYMHEINEMHEIINKKSQHWSHSVNLKRNIQLYLLDSV